MDDVLTCDMCGADLGNGGIDKCAILSDLTPDKTAVRLIRFCRENGCADKVLALAVKVPVPAEQPVEQS